eukprot:941003_1
MAKLPDHFAESGKNIRNMRKWTLNDICEYNECNSDQQKYQIVQYGCGKVGQRTSIKGHAKRCDDCDITDPRIKVMDCVNQEWVEPKGNEVFVGFEKGTGSKRQRKKQKANTNQRGLAHFFGWSKKDPDANKTQTNHSNNRVEDTNEQDPNQTEPNHNHSHNSAEDTDSKQQELQDGWQCLEDDTSEATRSIDVGVDNRTKVTERMTEPAHLLLRYGHDGLALFEEEEDDSIKLFCENCTETVGNKDGYVWEDTNQKAAMKQVCYWHFDERSERRHGPKEPVSWKGFIPRCQAIMSTMFLTLIRMKEVQGASEGMCEGDVKKMKTRLGNRFRLKAHIYGLEHAISDIFRIYPFHKRACADRCSKRWVNDPRCTKPIYVSKYHQHKYYPSKPIQKLLKKPKFDNLDTEDDMRSFDYLIDDALDNESDNDVVNDMRINNDNRKRKRSEDENENPPRKRHKQNSTAD